MISAVISGATSGGTSAQHRLRRFGLLMFVGVVLLFVSAAIGPLPPAAAHEQLISTDPAAGTRVVGPVREVRLRFSGPIAPGFAALTLSVDGQPPRMLESRVDGAEVVGVAPVVDVAAAQQWTVGYRVVSADGHPISDVFGFTIQPATGSAAPSDRASSTAGSPTVPAPTSSRSAVPGWILLGATGGLLGLGAAMVIPRLRKRPSARHRSGRDAETDRDAETARDQRDHSRQGPSDGH